MFVHEDYMVCTRSADTLTMVTNQANTVSAHADHTFLHIIHMKRMLVCLREAVLQPEKALLKAKMTVGAYQGNIPHLHMNFTGEGYGSYPVCVCVCQFSLFCIIACLGIQPVVRISGYSAKTAAKLKSNFSKTA